MGTITVPEFKVILCGEYGVGKTSLFRRFLNDSFIDTSNMSLTQTRQSTLGICLNNKHVVYSLSSFL